MKSIKKLCVLGLAIVTVVTSTFVVPANGAAKVKINKKSLELTVGQKYKLKVTGTRKKVKWSTNKKKIATVKKGTVTAKAPGQAKITAKVGKKKYTCKVNVKPATTTTIVPPSPVISTPAPVVDPQQQIFNNTLAQGVSARADKLASGDILYTFVNNNTQAIPTLKVNIMLCDSNGAPVDTDTLTIEDFLPGEIMYDTYSYTSKASMVDTNTSKISVTVTQGNSNRKYVTSSVSVTGAKNVDDKMVMTYVNNTVHTVYIRGCILYKDANGGVLAVESIYDSVSPGATEFDTLSRPYYNYDSIDHEAYDDIAYASADWIYRAYYY